MSSNAPELGGHKSKFVSEPPVSFICLICTFVAKDPQQMDCCGKVYCRLYLTEHMKHSNKCPQCRIKGNSFNDKRGEKLQLGAKLWSREPSSHIQCLYKAIPYC